MLALGQVCCDGGDDSQRGVCPSAVRDCVVQSDELMSNGFGCVSHFDVALGILVSVVGGLSHHLTNFSHHLVLDKHDVAGLLGADIGELISGRIYDALHSQLVFGESR